MELNWKFFWSWSQQFQSETASIMLVPAEEKVEFVFVKMLNFLPMVMTGLLLVDMLVFLLADMLAFLLM